MLSDFQLLLSIWKAIQCFAYLESSKFKGRQAKAINQHELACLTEQDKAEFMLIVLQ